MFRRTLILCALAALSLVPCSAVTLGAEVNHAARFLAGLPSLAGSPYQALESDPAWIEHKTKLDEIFAKIENRRTKPQREFAQTEVAGVDKAKNVFYPFAGADAWNVYLFFPNAESYTLIGLEPPGTLRNVEKLIDNPEHLASNLKALRYTLRSILELSFFVTREMDREFRGQITDGLLIPILVLLERHDVTIESLRYALVSDTGQLIDRDPKDPKLPRNKNKCVEIKFTKNGRSQTLRYLSADLVALQFNTGLLMYLDTLGRVNTYLKATSYMPHHEDCDIIRANILSRSDLILQDDSGMPLRFFTPEEWDVRLYGRYVQPITVFRYRSQKDLRAAYQEPGRARELKFPIGYGSGRSPSNLQMAIRRK
jgi:hypothetical protein